MATAVNVNEQSVVIYDPSPVWLIEVEDALLTSGMRVAACTRDPEQALALLEQHRPDLLVADPAGPGVELVREARRRIPALKAIALGALAEAGHVSAVLAAGAAAFVVKSEQFDGFGAEAREGTDTSPVQLDRVPGKKGRTVAA